MDRAAYTGVRDLLRPGKPALRTLRTWLRARAWTVRTGGRRRRLRRSLPGVRAVSAGPFRLHGVTVDGYTAAAAAADDLTALAGLLDRAGVPYFLVSEPTADRHVLGVEEERRPEVLSAARLHLRDTPAFVAAVGGDGTPTAVALWSDGAVPRAIRRAGVIRTGTVRLGPGGRPLHGLEAGCEIEFWRRGDALEPDAAGQYPWLTVPAGQLGDDLADSLVSPRRNRISEVVPREAQKPAVATVRGHRLPTFQPFTESGVGDVRFPVDVVYTWVDGDDPALAAKRRAYRESTGSDIADREVGASRYTSHDELRFSLRSLEMYAPFVRHVYLVTDGQVPAWLDPGSDGITVVDHRDILPGDALPVFNSHAIESRLHHIPGLSDHYLYFNDDVFVNRPVRAETFFHGNGLAKLPFSPFKLGLGRPYPQEPAPNSAGKNARELIGRTFGRTIVGKFLHVPHPQLLAVLRDIEGAGLEEYRRTAYSRFRSVTDVASVATLHHHWALLSGRAVPADYTLRYVDLGRPDLRTRLARLERGENVDFFCINDVDTPGEIREAAAATVRAFLERRFPFPSRAERGRSAAASTAAPRAVTGLLARRTGPGRPVKLESPV